jgi:hypothetical protein
MYLWVGYKKKKEKNNFLTSLKSLKKGVGSGVGSGSGSKIRIRTNMSRIPYTGTVPCKIFSAAPMIFWFLNCFPVQLLYLESPDSNRANTWEQNFSSMVYFKWGIYF